jgi:hypothetical protein
VTCVFSALSYAELASTIAISGSAYSYAYSHGHSRLRRGEDPVGVDGGDGPRFTPDRSGGGTSSKPVEQRLH